MNLFPGLRSVLVLDNIDIYLSKDLTIIYKETGIYLKYLSLYLSNYNSIEEFFSTLKAWMRRNRELVSAFKPFFKDYIHLVI
jgi:hypothetical protein